MNTAHDHASIARRHFDEALLAYCHHRHGGDDPLARACRYALEGRGKRVRPIICQLAALAVGDDDPRIALRAALSLELVHTYSLVHDDLPAMDDDDLRRGRPTTHIVHGEALAILAGDALLTDAFAVLTRAGAVPAAAFADLASLPRRARLVEELAEASGSHGMVLGQALDLAWTGQSAAAGPKVVEQIHMLKTGRLLGAAAAMGAASACDDESAIASMRTFGRALGLAFQIRDDLLDDAVGTGKSAGKDRAAAKLTFLAHMDRQTAEKAAAGATQEALDALAPFGARSRALAEFAELLLTRQS